MAPADRDALCGTLLRALQGERDYHSAGEVLAGVLPGATPPVLDAALAFAADRANPWYKREPIVRAAAPGLDAARLDELWQVNADPSGNELGRGLALPLACKGSEAQADSVVRWCEVAGLSDVLAEIVRKAPDAVARRAWQALLRHREEEEWLIAALGSGRRFPAELSVLVAGVVAAAEKGDPDDAYRTYRVLAEGVLPAVPRSEAIGLRAAQLAGELSAQHANDNMPMQQLLGLDLRWLAQLAVRLPAGTERDALLAEAVGIIERGQTARPTGAETREEEFDRLLLRSALEATPDSQDLSLVLDSFAEWPLLLPMRCKWSGERIDLSIASLCAVPPPTLRPIWARSLRVFATSGRAGLADELAYYAPLLQHTGGIDAARRLARELMALPRWWP
jgi:hypothetical protein